MANHKRINWDEYFLNIAKDVASRSTCLRRNYGAVIVDKDHRIVATGYNGAARKETDCLSKGICRREELNIPHGQNYELCVAVHAEANAIINCDPKYFDGTSTIYIYGYMADTGEMCDGTPCMMCDRMIKNARLNRVYYKDGKLTGDNFKTSESILRTYCFTIGQEGDKVLSGTYAGYKTRQKIGLDKKDKDEFDYKFILPDSLMAFTASYFLGCFQESVKTLGVEKFKEKYSFECSNPSIMEHIEMGIKTSNEITLLDRKYINEDDD